MIFSKRLPRSHIRVLQIISPSQLLIEFRDGETYPVSLETEMSKYAYFAPLKDAAMFGTARVYEGEDDSIVAWKCGLELHAEFLYKMAKKQAGEPVPRTFRPAIRSIIFLAIFAYIWLPVEPKVPKAFELHEIIGVPKYVNTSSTTNSSEDLKINDTYLHCTLGSLGGSDGCQVFKSLVDPAKPARATYFFQPTRLWYHYKVLNSLEQDGKIIVSQERLHAVYLEGYKSQFELYNIFNGIIAVGVCIVILLSLFEEKIINYFMSIKK